jgi:hypothetical protein
VQGFHAAVQSVFDVHQTGHGNALSVSGYPILAKLAKLAKLGEMKEKLRQASASERCRTAGGQCLSTRFWVPRTEIRRSFSAASVPGSAE